MRKWNWSYNKRQFIKCTGEKSRLWFVCLCFFFLFHWIDLGWFFSFAPTQYQNYASTNSSCFLAISFEMYVYHFGYGQSTFTRFLNCIPTKLKKIFGFCELKCHNLILSFWRKSSRQDWIGFYCWKSHSSEVIIEHLCSVSIWTKLKHDKNSIKRIYLYHQTLHFFAI